MSGDSKTADHTLQICRAQLNIWPTDTAQSGNPCDIVMTGNHVENLWVTTELGSQIQGINGVSRDRDSAEWLCQLDDIHPCDAAGERAARSYRAPATGPPIWCAHLSCMTVSILMTAVWLVTMPMTLKRWEPDVDSSSTVTCRVKSMTQLVNTIILYGCG